MLTLAVFRGVSLRLAQYSSFGTRSRSPRVSGVVPGWHTLVSQHSIPLIVVEIPHPAVFLGVDNQRGGVVAGKTLLQAALKSSGSSRKRQYFYSKDALRLAQIPCKCKIEMYLHDPLPNTLVQLMLVNISRCLSLSKGR